MNKTFQRIVSIIVSLVVLLSVAVVPGYAVESDRIIWDQEQAYNEGYTPLTTQEFISGIQTINNAFEVLLGFRLIPEEKFEITVNGFLNDIFADIKEETDGVLDCDMLIHSLPSLAESSNKVKTLLELDMDVVDPALKEAVDEYYSQGNSLAGFLVSLLRAYLKTMESCELYSVPVEGEEGLFELYLALNFEYGESETFSTGIIYDSVNNTLNNKDNTGIVGIGFVLDTEDYTISTAINSWQRNFGFMIAYDIFSYVTNFFDYVTVRIKFDYDNREWMVQLWKGRYLIAPGGEIGIYNRDMGSLGTFYNCASDEDMMVMSLKLYHQEEMLFEMEPTLHWWLTGFQLHPKAYIPESLTMRGTIDFPTAEMATLFADKANATGEIEATQNGANVAFIW